MDTECVKALFFVLFVFVHDENVVVPYFLHFLNFAATLLKLILLTLTLIFLPFIMEEVVAIADGRSCGDCS